MSAFLLTPEARADLLAIREYIAAENPKAAALVLDRLEQHFRKLAAMPGMGHYREDLLGRRYRFWSADSYIVAYRWKARPIQIIAIIHSARDLDAFFPA